MAGQKHAWRMKFLLDSNIVIAVLFGDNEKLRERMAAAEVDDFVTSALVFAEVAHGSVRGKPPSFDRLERLVAAVPALPFDYLAARAYATIPFKRGRIDRLIAAQALSLGLTVITDNEADFADVPGLAVENWSV
jgi:tRNA(fMet)-specific endonuclease VapC